MSDYNIDRLSIEIQTQATQAETSIDRLISKVSSLSGEFSKLQSSISALGGASSTLSGISSALGSISSSASSMSTLSTNTQKLTASLSGGATGATNTTRSMSSGFSTSSSSVQKCTVRVNKLTSALKDTKTQSDKANDSLTGMAKSLSKGLKLGAIGVVAKKLGDVVSSWITASNQFVENKNLFDVQMQGFNQNADEFIDKLNEVLGVDPSEAMRYLGFFQQLSTGMGVASDKAYTISKNMTQLGYDLSSFINIPIEDAMLKIQSGLAGEIEPLRRVGYALTETTLQQTLYEHGINRKIRTLTDAEKVELRYVAIMEASTKAQGDMARTLMSPANQIRILQQNIIQCARALGNIFLPALQIVIPWVTAFVQVIRDAANFIAKLFGFEIPEFDYDFDKINAGASGLDDTIGNVNDDLDDTKKKVKDLYAPFDELNVLKEPDSSSSGDSGTDTSAGAGGGGLFDDLPEYDMFAGAVETKIEELKGKIESLLPVIGGVTGAFAAWKLTPTILSGLGTLHDKSDTLIKKVKDSPFGKWKIPMVLSTKLGNLNDKIPGLIKKIKDNPFKLWKIGGLIGVTLGIMAGHLVELKKNSKSFNKGLERIDDITSTIKEGWDNMKEAFDEVFLEPLSDFWEEFVDGLPDGVKAVVEKIEEWLDGLDLKFSDVTTTAAGLILLFVPGGQVFGLALLGFEAITLGIRGIGSESDETWDETVDGAKKKLSKENFTKAFQGIKDAFTAIIDFCKDPAESWDKIKDSATDNIVKDDYSGVKGAFRSVFDGFVVIIGLITDPINTWQKIKDSAKENNKEEDYGSGIGGIFYTLFRGFGIIIGLITNPVKTWNKIKESAADNIKSGDWANGTGGGIFGKIWDGFGIILSLLTNPKKTWQLLKDEAKKQNKKSAWGLLFSPIWDAFKSNVIDKITDAFNTIKDTIKEIFNSINTPAGAAPSTAASYQEAKTSVKRNAAGGFPSMGELFIARESGAELVGSIGSRTAVANNDQIVRSVAIGVANAVSSVLGAGGGGTQNITVTTLLDGEVVYKNQQKVAKRRGVNFNMGAFAR